GREKSGATAPSVSTGRFPSGELSGLLDFAARDFDRTLPEIFNRFEPPLCDAALGTDLRDLPAVGRRGFATFVFARTAGFAPTGLRADGLEDFLRDFLDIRLPFVAFGGSIMRPLQVVVRPTGIEPPTRQVWRRRGMVTRISTRLFARRKSS